MAKKAIIKDKPEIAIKKDMRDYSNEPYFVKKAEKATAFLNKHGLPKDFTKEKK